MADNSISTDLIRQLEKFFQSRQLEVEASIRTLVEIESPSGDEQGSRCVVDVLAETAGSLTCVNAVERVNVPGFGQHLLVRAFQQNVEVGQIMLVGHTDTVHSRGSLSERPWRREGEKIYGPGIFDMKANCVLSLELLRSLQELKITPPRSITLALTCDEEVGSNSGGPFLEGIAESRQTRCALVLEPPAIGGHVKTGRKGTGIFEIKVEGKAAHAGLEPEKGASAILELARQTERLHAINKSGSGITVNVGVVRGGTRSNVIAAEAQAEIDVRFSTEAESRDIERILNNLQPIDDRTRVFVAGGINRPPLERTRSVVELFERARQIAATLGFDLGEAQVGGASDGNFLAAMGIPVLDGLGINGDGAHAMHEHIDAQDIPRRGALLAGLLATI
jgi:glutamate carboxypeptidase